MQGGDPNVANSKGQTSIHLICTTANARDSLESQIRADMLTFTMDYCVKKKKKTVELASLDKSLNSPLHLAVTSGLVKCVEILVSSNVSVISKNIAGQTPMDCLQKSPYRSAIGAILEPKMVFASTESSTELANKPQFLREESYKPYHEERLKKLQEDYCCNVQMLLVCPEYTPRPCSKPMDGHWRLLKKSGWRILKAYLSKLE